MNILDYLKERGDILFTEDPFNEVDGLVLAELVYASFDGILDENSDLDIVKVNEAFWRLHSEKEILDQHSFTKMAPFLLKEMASSKRYAGTRLKHYVSDISLKEVKQFAAITLSLPDGTDYVAYRGTDGTVAGWMEDFKLSFSTTSGQDDAYEYLDRFHGTNIRPLRLGGHSKGGNLAAYAAIFASEKIKRNIQTIYSYDGPGFKDEIVDSSAYQEILDRVVSVIPKDCMVGIMMKNRYKHIVTDSDNLSILQHDAYAWHIVKNRFEEVKERTEESIFFEKTLNEWLTRFNEVDRERVLDTFAYLVLNNDVLFKNNEKLSTSFFYDLLVHSPKLKDEDKDIIVSSIKDLMSSMSEIASDEFKEKLDELNGKLEMFRKLKILNK